MSDFILAKTIAVHVAMQNNFDPKQNKKKLKLT